MEIIVILLLIALNGAFALSEMAIVSSRKARLQQRANAGDTRAQAALEMARAPTQVLSTVQIGITLVGQVAGVFGGATLANQLAGYLQRYPPLAPYSSALGLGLVVLLITYLSLVLGELTPKRLALHSPERIAIVAAAPLHLLSRIAYPAVRLLGLSSDLVLRLMGVRASTEPPVTEEEIRLLLQEGAAAGVFETAEHDMVTGVFRLGDARARDVMTPRMEIVWLDESDTKDTILRKVSDTHHFLFPVCRGSLDQVLGVAQTSDMLVRCLEGGFLEPGSLLHRPLFVPEMLPAGKLLEMFKETEQPLALVVDEYGVVQGLVTLSDILEEVVGEIGVSEPPAVQREDGSWLLDGLMPIDEFKATLGLSRLPLEGQEHFQTLGGLVVTHLGRIPTSGEQFAWAELRFEVVDMDGNRVDKVIVSRLPEDGG